jgi:hypothetical protein
MSLRREDPPVRNLLETGAKIVLRALADLPGDRGDDIALALIEVEGPWLECDRSTLVASSRYR